MIASATGLVIALTLMSSGALAAQPIDHFHDKFSDSFSDELCGIPVEVVVGTGNFSVRDDDSFKATGSFRWTVTNSLNGNAVVISSAGQVSGVPVIDEKAGTITFLTTFIGLPEKIRTGHGEVLLRDAGVISFEDTFDLQTGELLSSQTLVKRGPHPEADSDFTLSAKPLRKHLVRT